MGAVGAKFPMALAIIGAAGLTFSLMVHSATGSEKDSTSFRNCNIGNGWCIGDFFSLVWDLLTFNIDGAPWWIRLPMSLVFIGPWVLLLISVVIGAIP